MKRNQDKVIHETFANNEYITLQRNHQETDDFNSERLQENTQPFNYMHYATTAHAPEIIDLDFDSFVQANSLNLPRCLDMPIRLAGETEYKLPTLWQALQKDFEKLITIEEKHNPNWQDYYTYITVDTKPVTTGEQQRHGGLHVDGFQGERIQEKTKISRNYVGTSNGGTQFYPQRFIVADPQKFNVFQGFDLQIDQPPLIAIPDYFYFMDAYTVHESGFAEYDGDRLFIRLTYDLKPFDRLGNTHNPNLNYNWDMVERTAQDQVEKPKLTDILESPYFPYASQ